ncbi:LuxR C-terminal-related transcriptional regulator [Lysobacter yangpyeongensis]|uniref:LuxR C-terminal-related transcriptional regulator n=1 Tax=Lysobacter yangpyeongensis TaxID=346182 RepID=A0ABW0SJ23_9GAMM
MFDFESALKTVPPRLPQSSLKREHLTQRWKELRECTAIAVTAPAGFGKTTLLLQWRHLWLNRDATVVWLTADAQDTPAKFTTALLRAFRSPGAFQYPSFDTLAMLNSSAAGRELEVLTGLLAEVAHAGTETVLMIDEAERLPAATQDLVGYLFINAPANFRLVVGSRNALPIRNTELAAKGQLALVSDDDLRFRLDESLEIMRRRLGRSADLSDHARLHESTQGWPIGLQLAMITVEQESNIGKAIRSLSSRPANLHDYLVGSLLIRLPEAFVSSLTRLSILDYVSDELCQTLLGPDGGDVMAKIAEEMPTMTVGDRGALVLHPLVRDHFRERFEQLPHDERIALHARASLWFAEHGQLHTAARHAYASGDDARAHDLALSSLWLLGAEGRLAEARELLTGIPPQVLARDPTTRLKAAWIEALGTRNDQALATARAVAEDPRSTPVMRMTALRIAGGAASYSDRLGLLPGFVDAWPTETPEVVDPLYLVAPLNGRALVALQLGRTGEVRELTEKVRSFGTAGSLRLAAAFSSVISALGHLWEGNAFLAEEGLEEALAQAEREEGRRGMVSCLYAAVLAAAWAERDRAQAVVTLMADRLDVIEQSGFPDTILAAYRALARASFRQGNERKALTILSSLGAIGERRNMPRLSLYSLAEQIRIHAMRARVETAEKLVRALEKLTDAFAAPEFRVFARQHELALHIAYAYIALARADSDKAQQALRAAMLSAEELGHKREAMTIQALRAIASRLEGNPDALPLLSEALGLAHLGGVDGLAESTHPIAVRMAGELRRHLDSRTIDASPVTREQARVAPPVLQAIAAEQGLLTAKEADILQLLARGMPNKLIAKHLSIGDETVKWHLKNIFGKLSAANRRHAIDRARMLGLVHY